MRVKGVDDQLQELIDFSLKFTFRHGYFFTSMYKYKTSDSNQESFRQPVNRIPKQKIRRRKGSIKPVAASTIASEPR
jgi:hypothetical protein